MMDKSSLIDFNNEKCYKISSPLIPPPQSSEPRLSILDNNPFDKVLKIIANKDDPFEYNPDAPIINKSGINSNDIENKENIGHLVSPIQTPVKLKRHKKLSSTPLFISSNSKENQGASTSQLPSISEVHNLSVDCNETDTSLHILSESFLNNVEGDMSNSFMVACNLPLPSSPDEETSNINENEKFHRDIPTISIKDESRNSVNNSTYNVLNNGFIDTTDNLKKLSVGSSLGSKCSFNPNSFRSGSLGSTEISDVNPNVSSITSKENSSFNNPFDNAFIEDKNSHRIPSTNMFRDRENVKFNNSFGGFNYPDRRLTYAKGSYLDNVDDSVFLEAIRLADVFHKSAMCEDFDENIFECAPPWLEEDIVFLDVEENNIDDNDVSLKNSVNVDAKNEEMQSKIECNDQSSETAQELHKKETVVVTINDNHEERSESPKNIETSDTELKNAKDLLNNLTALLNNSGTNKVDQRKLGESLINSLALALNIENPTVNCSNEQSPSINKLQRSKSDSRVSDKIKSMEKQENKFTVPKLKSKPPAPVDKNLKVKNEKEKAREKVTGKGPLKAFIPLTNMAKNKKGSIQKQNLATPPKQFLQTSFHIKKTSTPNEHKMKPIAQSTPEVSKLQGLDVNNATPLSKKHFGFSVSPLARPTSTNDISIGCQNSSLSPKGSGSIPNLNKSNSKLPTIKYTTRRNSASDMSTSRSNSLNRSYDSNHTARPPIQLKRSSSFQNKSTTATQKSSADNNNSVKKYGMPGTLKSLKLVPKDKRINKI